MSFDKLIGNEKVKQTLKEIIQSKNILHSYMFVGQSGIGKKQFAIEFAKAILCNNKDIECNTCSSCIKFESKNHPDFNIIEKDENSIKIEQIREKLDTTIEKPIVSDKKIYIINDAEYMTQETQNCLLKTLEEPVEFIVIILIVENESLLLDTIKSRCTKIVFNKIDDEMLINYLAKQYQIININKSMLKLYNGSISKAVELNEKQELYQVVKKIIDNIEQNNIIDILNSAEVIYKSKDNINNILDYINIILYEKSVNNIRYINCISIVEETKRKIKSNANFDMSIDNLLIRVWEEINEKHSRS